MSCNQELFPRPASWRHSPYQPRVLLADVVQPVPDDMRHPEPPCSDSIKTWFLALLDYDSLFLGQLPAKLDPAQMVALLVHLLRPIFPCDRSITMRRNAPKTRCWTIFVAADPSDPAANTEVLYWDHFSPICGTLLVPRVRSEAIRAALDLTTHIEDAMWLCPSAVRLSEQPSEKRLRKMTCQPKGNVQPSMSAFWITCACPKCAAYRAFLGW